MARTTSTIVRALLVSGGNMSTATQVKVVGENGAVSIVDYPFTGHSAKIYDYLLQKRMIELHEVDDDEVSTPAETARRIIPRRPSPRDVAPLR